jgi:CheY-like chemotaxis protein
MKTILIIDDDADIRASLIELLESEGYQVRVATNGEEGLKEVKTKKPDLIILDAQMPIMNGWEFKEQFDADPSNKGIPLFVFSASRDNRPPGLSAVAYVPKPIHIDELLTTIRKHI